MEESRLQVCRVTRIYTYKCAGVWDSKAREAKCDLRKSLRKMLVSNLSPLFGKEILVPTTEARQILTCSQRDQGSSQENCVETKARLFL